MDKRTDFGPGTPGRSAGCTPFNPQREIGELNKALAVIQEQLAPLTRTHVIVEMAAEIKNLRERITVLEPNIDNSELLGHSSEEWDKLMREPVNSKNFGQPNEPLPEPGYLSMDDDVEQRLQNSAGPARRTVIRHGHDGEYRKAMPPYETGTREWASTQTENVAHENLPENSIHPSVVNRAFPHEKYPNMDKGWFIYSELDPPSRHEMNHDFDAKMAKDKEPTVQERLIDSHKLLDVNLIGFPKYSELYGLMQEAAQLLDATQEKLSAYRDELAAK